MPEPRARPRIASGPVPIWPSTLPGPVADGFAVSGPMRVEVADVLAGVTRLATKSRTAPASWEFSVNFTPAQFEIWEAFYRDCIENYDGEFYAPWIGGDRVVALVSNYTLVPLGRGCTLQAVAIRTRIDHTACDAILNDVFSNIYRADLAAVDIYTADLTGVDLYQDMFDLDLIADNEC